MFSKPQAGHFIDCLHSVRIGYGLQAPHGSGSLPKRALIHAFNAVRSEPQILVLFASEFVCFAPGLRICRQLER